MWGLGTTFYIRGPDPDPDSWGAIAYNSTSDLILEAEKVHFSGSGSFFLYGNITIFNFECTTPWQEIYFQPQKTYIFKEIEVQ